MKRKLKLALLWILVIVVAGVGGYIADQVGDIPFVAWNILCGCFGMFIMPELVDNID